MIILVFKGAFDVNFQSVIKLWRIFLNFWINSRVSNVLYANSASDMINYDIFQCFLIFR